MSTTAAQQWLLARVAYQDHLRTELARTGPRKGQPLRQNVRYQYVQHVQWLEGGVDVGPWDVRAHRIQAWLGEQTWSTSLRRRVVVSLRRFYAWAIVEELCQWSPVAGVAVAAGRRRGPDANTLPPAWVEPMREHLDVLRAAGRSPGTLEQRRWQLLQVAAWAADPWAVTGQQLVAWAASQDVSRERRRALRSNIRMFYGWAVDMGYLEKSPAEALPKVRIPRALPRPTPDDVVVHALAQADDRARLAIMLAGYAGLRRFEIAKLHTSEISISARHPHLVIEGKGGHDRFVPIHPHLVAELQAEIDRRRRGQPGTGFSPATTTVPGYLFPTDRDANQPITPAHLAKVVREALGEQWTTHTLRHRFASEAYDVQRDLRAVQELLGHQRPETTARYAAVPDGAMEAAVAGVGIDPALWSRESA